MRFVNEKHHINTKIGIVKHPVNQTTSNMSNTRIETLDHTSQGNITNNNEELEIEHLVVKENLPFHTRAHSIDSFSLKIFPLSFLAISLIYWLYFTNFGLLFG